MDTNSPSPSYERAIEALCSIGKSNQSDCKGPVNDPEICHECGGKGKIIWVIADRGKLIECPKCIIGRINNNPTKSQA